MSTRDETRAFPRATASDRGLPPIPRGWFVVGLSEDLLPGQVRPLRYFGRDLVMFRTDSGVAQVWDAHCPHLGAHLGHGGRVEGESIRCAFHHWRFDVQGQCVEVPGCDRVPPKGRARPWPVAEQNGTILAWFDPDGGAPTWHIEPLPDEGWTAPLSIIWDLRSHPQEIGENTVDTAHMKPVHETGRSRVRYGPDIEPGRMTIGLAFVAPGSIIGMDGDNDVELDVTMWGLGYIGVQAHVTNAGVHARYRICSTPIDEERIHVFGVANMQQTDDPEFTEEVAGLFFEALTRDFVKDFPIWENKVYRARPALSAADGPIGAYRRFARQFYPAQAQVAASAQRRSPIEVEDLREPMRERALVSVRGLLSRVRGVVDGVAGQIGLGGNGHAAASGNGHAGSNGSGHTSGRNGSGHAPGGNGNGNGRAPKAVTPSLRVGSVADYFQTLDQRFRPTGAKGVRAVFQWDLRGEGGGTYHAVVDDGQMELHEGAHAEPTVTLSIDADEYVKVINGELDGTRAFTVGSGKVRGKLRMAMKMRDIFPQ